MDNKTVSGIYQIRNIVTDKVYVGSSKDIRKRWKRHLESLRKSCHHNIYLNRSFTKYGEHCFEFSILEEVFDTTKLFERESYWINNTNSTYNIGAVGGGDNFSNHPEKERIREVHIKNLKKLRDQGKVPPTGKGENNPNWRGGLNICKTTSCDKLVPRSNKSGYCNLCFNRNHRKGKDNAFFGKTHTDATKSKIREANKGKVPPNRRVLYCNGFIFSNLTLAAKTLRVSAGTLVNRCKSKNYPEFKYMT